MTDRIVWKTPLPKKPWLRIGHDSNKHFFYKKFCFTPNMDPEDKQNISYHCATEIIIRTYLHLVKSTVTTFNYAIFIEPESEDIRKFMENRLRDKEAIRNACSDLRNEFEIVIENASVQEPLEITLKMEYGEPDVRNQIRDLANKLDSESEILLLLEKLFELLSTADHISLLLLDLKPENLLRTLRDSKETWVLNDFDVSRLMRNNEYPSGEANLAHTWPYSAPEQILRNAPLTCKTDVYAASLIGYELLNDGELPTVLRERDSSYQVAIMDTIKKGTQKIEPPENGPEWLKALIMQGLSFDPAQRPKAKKILEEIQKHRNPERGSSMKKTKIEVGGDYITGNGQKKVVHNSSWLYLILGLAVVALAVVAILHENNDTKANTGASSNAMEQTTAIEMQPAVAPVSTTDSEPSAVAETITSAAGDSGNTSIHIENNGIMVSGDAYIATNIGSIDNSTHVTEQKANSAPVTPETPATTAPLEEPQQPDPEPEPVTTQWYACSGETLTTVYSIPDDFRIPDGITVIGAGAFQGFGAELQGEKLDLQNIVRIEERAFEGCSPSYVYFSTQLKYVGSHAFDSDRNTSIEFEYDGDFTNFKYDVKCGSELPFGNTFHLIGIDFDSAKGTRVMEWLQNNSSSYQPS